ncbi:cytidylyltransferase domain-containing protein [Catenovulum agarivorans]|uniref:acylneuraminate cytidylyltransferase family protein n=1 Tax=Catenovulum agarivorans TaxID=1172192 RepID=UPI000310AC9D|nr:hypothetical protein [Catenovulum agarivorans]
MATLAIMTARGGSKSVKNKNTMKFHGKPLYAYNLEAALKCEKIDKVAVTTDIGEILEHDGSQYLPIPRPNELCGDNASHHETMVHALNFCEKKLSKTFDTVIVLLGNSVGACEKSLAEAIDILEQSEYLDSVISVSEFNMFNPFRAYKISADDRLDTIVPQDFIKSSLLHKNSNDKKSAGDVYFFNGAFWVIRRSALLSNEGLLPFPWLGKNIHAYKQDVFMEVDAPWQIKCVEEAIKNA